MKYTKLPMLAMTICIGAIIMTSNGCKKVEPEQPDPILEAIELVDAHLDLVEGDHATLEVILTPQDIKDIKIVWTTSDDNIVTVDQMGNVVAVSEGEAEVTVHCPTYNKKDVCKVTVHAKYIPVEKITLDKTVLDIVEGQTAVLTAIVAPDNATDKTLEWLSDNPSVATVDNGTVTAKSVGTATITVTIQDSKPTSKSIQDIKATCTVNVEADHIEISGLTLSISSARLWEGQTVSIAADVKPDDASSWILTWSSSAEDIATVVDGDVIAHSEGNATITATLTDDKTGLKIEKSCVITVDKFKFTKAPASEIWGEIAQFQTNDSDVEWSLIRQSELPNLQEDNTSITSDGKILMRPTALRLVIGGKKSYKPVYNNVAYTVKAKQRSTGKTISTTVTSFWWRAYLSIITEYGTLKRIENVDTYEFYTGDEIEIRIETSAGRLEDAFDRGGFVVEIPLEEDGGGFRQIDELFPQCLEILEGGSNYTIRVGVERYKETIELKNIYL